MKLAVMLAVFGPMMFTSPKSSPVQAPSHKHVSARATCSPTGTCRACKNCKYCNHCSKRGGSCSVCR